MISNLITADFIASQPPKFPSPLKCSLAKSFSEFIAKSKMPPAVARKITRLREFNMFGSISSKQLFYEFAAVRPKHSTLKTTKSAQKILKSYCAKKK